MIRLSLKNIIRKKSRTMLVYLFVAIAALNIFIQSTQKNSVRNSMKRFIGNVISGQYIVYNSDEEINILESQFSDLELFQWNRERSDSLKNSVQFIENIAPRLRFGGMLSYKEESIGMIFHALTPDHLNRISLILNFVKGGMPKNESDLIMSDEFAELLECEVGDTLVVLANNKDGYLMCVSPFRIFFSKENDSAPVSK